MFTLCEVLVIQIELLLLRGKKPQEVIYGSVSYRTAHREGREALEILTHMVRWRLKEELSGSFQAVVLSGLNFKGCKEFLVMQRNGKGIPDRRV